MNQREAIEVLESIRDIYPKSDQTKRKANMLLPKLTQMDFPLVMEKLSAHVAEGSCESASRNKTGFSQTNGYLAKGENK